MAGNQDLFEIEFRLIDGSDICLKSFPSTTSIATLKESIFAQWPKASEIDIPIPNNPQPEGLPNILPDNLILTPVVTVAPRQDGSNCYENNNTNTSTQGNAAPWARLETSIDKILSAVILLQRVTEDMKHRINELDKKCEIMLCKIVKIESIKDVGKPTGLNEVKPSVNVNFRSLGSSDKPTNGAGACTPKRGYNRKSTTNVTPRGPSKLSTNMIVDLCDEDYDLGNKPNSRGKNIPGTAATTIKRPPTMSFTNNNLLSGDHQSLSGFRIGLSPLGSAASSASKRLSFTVPATPTLGTGKRSNSNSKLGYTPMKGSSSKENAKKKKNMPTEAEDEDEPYTPFGMILPSSVESTFRPTADMGLMTERLRIVAYVFSPTLCAGEVVMKIGYTQGTRQDFQGLTLGNTIKREIIRWMALKATWTQGMVTEQTTWSLPPEFARDVIEGTTLEELLSEYAKDWIKPFKELKFIYVPIEEYGGHWYLMVVCIEDQIIYHLDSHVTDETIGHKRDRIKNICNVLVQIMGSHKFLPNYVNELLDGENWDIMQPPRMPNCGHSFNSALWILQWMEMEYSFNPNRLSMELDEPVVRMNIAMDLLMGCHNEVGNSLEAKAAENWSKIAYSRSA